MQSSTYETARVLVVEDEPLALWVTRKSLETMGCSVTEADSCAVADEKLQNTRFDLVVLDYRLGDGFGVDVLRRIRERKDAVRAVMLTAEAESIPDSLRRELAIAAVLGKPLDVERLKAVAGTLLSEVIAGTRSHPPVDGGRPGQVGRFTMVTGPAVLTMDSLRQMAGAAGGAVWLAVDLRQVERMEAGVPDELIHMARACREGRGRLCVILTGIGMRKVLKEAGADRELDLLDDPGELDPAGRRLSAACERSAVLDAAVRRFPSP